MTDKMRVGVVGVGYLGKIHARIYGRMPDVELVGVVDTDVSAAEAAAKECNCAAFTDSAVLLDKVDAVSIVVPTVHHLAVARSFLERGIHMLLEKPIASTLEEGAEIIQLAEQGGAVLQIGHLERYNAGVMTLASRIKNPRFIEAHRIGEFVARATDVDVVTDLMIHDIDIILSVVDSEVADIQASGVSVISNSPDIANARIAFENGCVANLTASRISLKNMRKSRFFQKDAYISVDFLERKVEVVKMKDAPSNPGEFDMILQNAEGDRKQIYFENPAIPVNNPILDELEQLAQAIEKDETPPVPLQQGARALDVALKVIQAFGSPGKL